MSETVDSVAQGFLKHLSAKGMKSVPVQHTSFYSDPDVVQDDWFPGQPQEDSYW